MKSWIQKITLVGLYFLTLATSIDVMAQKITVRKTKGLSAIIDSSVPLEDGQSYELQTMPLSSDVNYSTVGLKSRQNSLTLGFNLSSFSADTVQSTQFSLQARYGWNFSILEFGVVGQGNYFDDGSGAKTDFAAGGYFDYNLITNRDSRHFIYGPFALLTVGSTQKKGGSANIIETNLGGFLSFYPGKNSTAFRLEGYLDNQQINSSVATASLTGFGARALMLYYF